MIRVFLFIFILALRVHAFAGAESGHGGGGVECINSAGLSEIEALDLWRGEQHGLTIIRTNEESVDIQIDRALIKIVNAIQNKSDRKENLKLMGAYLKMARKVANFVEVENFPIAKDLGFPKLPENCKPVGVGLYRDHFLFLTKNKLKVNSRIYNQLSNTDKAAFWVHEAEYSMERQLAGTLPNSLIVQRVVAIAFSQEDFQTPKWPPHKDGHWFWQKGIDF